MEELIRQAASAIQRADALVVTAGAGMGVDSGLPDFRGQLGFWRAYPAIAKLGLSFEEIANPIMFKQDPHLAWAFYGHRLALYRRTIPHPGFKKLLAMGATRKKGCFVFTSNVDGHFQKAGFPPDRVLECHGSIHHFQCVECCTRSIWDAEEEEITLDEAAFRAVARLPACRQCGGLARPNILMFGDWSWLKERTDLQEERWKIWLGELIVAGANLAIIELGAGTAIPTVRFTSERILKQAAATLIRINPREEIVPPGQIGLALGAEEGIQRICDQLGSFRGIG
jgi:NAD-dependent SIR2 family protein deacetylase